MSLDTAAGTYLPVVASWSQGSSSALRLRERALSLMKQFADLLLIAPSSSLARDAGLDDPIQRRLSKLEFAYSLPSPEDLEFSEAA